MATRTLLLVVPAAHITRGMLHAADFVFGSQGTPAEVVHRLRLRLRRTRVMKDRHGRARTSS